MLMAKLKEKKSDEMKEQQEEKKEKEDADRTSIEIENVEDKELSSLQLDKNE